MFNHPWNKYLDFTLTLAFAILIFFVPLVFWPRSSELFEFNKMMLTYAITGLIISTWFIQSVVNKQLSLKKNPLNLPIFLFFLGQLVTTIFSINPHTSIWGYYSRFHGGLVSTIAYASLFYIAVSHFSKPDQKNKIRFLFYSLLATTTLISAYGTLEHFGIDKNIWVQDVQNRVFSTLGQPNWLSAYLVATLPFPLLFSLHEKNKRNSLILGLISLLIFITILFTKSRSGIGTTFIVLFLVFLYQIATTGKKIRRQFKPLSILIFITVIAVGLIGSPWSPSPESIKANIELGGPIWPQIEPYLNRVHLTSQVKPLEIDSLPPEVQESIAAQEAGRPYGGSNSWDIRQVVWEGAIKLFKQHPLVGTGPETFGYSYYWTRPAAHNLLSEWDFLYNKAHNEYVNFLATTGIIGTSTYLLLIISTLFLFLKLHKQNKKDRLIITSFSLSYISILITNYFGFSVVPIALFFFLLPALTIAYTGTNHQTINLGKGWTLSKKELKQLLKIDSSPSLSVAQYFLITLLVIAYLFWFAFLAKHWLADTRYAKGKVLNQSGYVGEAITSLESATKLYPTEPNFRASLAESYANAALATQQQLNSLPATQSAQLQEAATQQEQQFTQLALDNIDKTLSQNPYHLNYIKSKAKIYLTLAQLDPNYYQQALNTLLRATELAPTDAKLVYNVGLLYLQLGDEKQAETAFRQAIELKPNYDQALVELSKLLINNQRTDELKSFLDQLFFYYPNHPFKETIDSLF